MEKINQNNLYQKIDEIYTGHRGVPIPIINKVFNSICKIIIRKGGKTEYGTGFFMKVSDLLKYLITNYHIINPYIINNHTEIEIWNKKRIKLTLKNRTIKYFERPKDITIMEIKKDDEIYDYIEFLDYDINFIKYGYQIYKNVDVFSIEHPFGKEAICASGSIINIFNNFEFNHNISTDTGSSGSPIILLNNNPNIIQVIGIHKNRDEKLNLNGGTFIGEIFNGINTNTNEKNNNKEIGIYKGTPGNINNHKILSKYPLNNFINKNKTKNIIIGEIYINKNNINKDIRIINSFENVKRENNWEDENDDYKYENEKEIKMNIEIKINGKKIKFVYYYKFKEEGKYIIEYSFENDLAKTNHMFKECNLLTNLDLSNFNTKNINNMSYMFCGCNSLTSLNLSNFNTQDVTDMGSMFEGCEKLTNLNLSSFNTKNVTDMKNMFRYCKSLTNLNLSNFNTQDVTDMGNMFSNCNSLTNLNLSNFNTQNVTNMTSLFYCCYSLTNLNISNFNTKNVTDMGSMFESCNLLDNLDLSNFNTQNVTDMNSMFESCNSLTNLNISNFNTKNVTDMSNMFCYCFSLTNLNLSNFNTKKVSDMKDMFNGCNSLKKGNIITQDNKILNLFNN